MKKIFLLTICAMFLAVGCQKHENELTEVFPTPDDFEDDFEDDGGGTGSGTGSGTGDNKTENLTFRNSQIWY